MIKSFDRSKIENFNLKFFAFHKVTCGFLATETIKELWELITCSARKDKYILTLCGPTTSTVPLNLPFSRIRDTSQHGESQDNL